MSNKLAIAKIAINFAAGAGVSKVVNDIIRNNVTIETTSDAAKVWIGSAVIGSMAADAGSKHVNAKVDMVTSWFEQRKAENTE